VIFQNHAKRKKSSKPKKEVKVRESLRNPLMNMPRKGKAEQHDARKRKQTREKQEDKDCNPDELHSPERDIATKE
jgi:hypothetical protein